MGNLAGESMSTPDKPRNRLSGESSPYLLQHQYNPVDWYPWGEEAFARARAENKPLLISIGYSACHWCHVMEHESFSNEEIARYINETVIPVKVDREERPDVDTIYMNACMAMTGHGGWPLNAFVTPDLKPFFVGTYFPPEDNYGRPGFRTVLTRIREAWVTEGNDLRLQAQALHRQLEQFQGGSDSQQLAPDLLSDIARDSASMFDRRNGGFGTAPKFPPDTRLAALLAAYALHQDTNALMMTTQTLTAMGRGGIYDQVAGGFARYSVDAQWLIPHFEKMLYNQALLIPVYVDAWLLSGNAEFERIARETADWVLRDLTASDGIFQCAYDADSEHVEGKFYVWTPDEIAAILPAEDAKLFCEYYGITPGGNFEHGTSNPNVTVGPSEFALAHGMSETEWQIRLNELRNTVRVAREKRVWPGLDDKCLTSWNGLMLTALCRLAQATGEAKYREAATRCADSLLKFQWDGTLLNRVVKDGKSSIRGTLEDYAFLADSLVDLYETTFDWKWLETVKEISLRMIEAFQAPDGSFYYTDGSDPSLISRTRDSHDGALPASSSVAARVLLRAGRYLQDEALIKAGTMALHADGRRVNQHPLAYASLVLASLYARPDFPEVVITAETPEAAASLLDAVYRSYLPARTIILKTAGTSQLPVIAADKPISEKPAAYVCRNFACQAPMSSANELAAMLAVKSA